MKAIFEIEWKDDLGEKWMNKDNLSICLNTKECCGKGLILSVKEIDFYYTIDQVGGGEGLCPHCGSNNVESPGLDANRYCNNCNKPV